MALELRCLTLLSTIKDELGIAALDLTKDARLERLITVATDLAESECDRVFFYQAGISERCKGYGTPQIVVGRTPVVTITSITELATLLSATEYEAVVEPTTRRADSGVILRKGGDYSLRAWPWTAARRPDIVQDKSPGSEAPGIVVVYAGGFVTPAQAASANWAADNPLAPVRTLPHDLEQAVVELVVSLYRNAGQDRNVSLEAVGDGSQSWGKGRAIIPDDVRTILAKYSRIAGA